MALSLPHHPQFHISGDPQSLGARWRKWTQRFQNLLVAMNITQGTRKRALLLHYAGESVHDIFNTLDNTGEPNDYDTALLRLNEYFEPQLNTEYDIFTFRRARQEIGETIDQFHTRLRELASTCNFAETNREIKSQIIQGCLSNKLRTIALRDRDLTLPALLNTARIYESAKTQALEMETAYSSNSKPNLSINYTSNNRRTQNNLPERNSQPNQHLQHSEQCKHCGHAWPHLRGQSSCPAKGQTCHLCGKLNHYASCCIAKQQTWATKPKQFYRTEYQRKDHSKTLNVVCGEEQIQHQQVEPSNEDQYIFSIEQSKDNVKIPETILNIEGSPIRIIIDTGASLNVLSKKDFDVIGKYTQKKLAKPDTRVFAYGNANPIPLTGKIDLLVHTKRQYKLVTFYITAVAAHSLLGYQTATELGLVHILHSLPENVREEKSSNPERLKVNMNSEDPKADKVRPTIFSGIGKLKGLTVDLHIDKSVTPVAQRHRRIPFHLRKNVEEEIGQLLSMGIIEKATGPTPWISPIVVVSKPENPDKIRICVDMREANKAIIRERHVMPTLDDIVTALNGSTVFSKIDLRKGYHQIEISEESRYITTFSCHLGLFRYKRLNFGISAASEIFQNVISQIISPIPGVLNVSDDILCHGASQRDHDTSLTKTLEAIENNGLTLSKEKCEFNKTEIDFYGNTFSKDGISVQQNKVKALNECTPPQNPTEVRSFIGMANFNAKFIPGFSELAKPLMDLTHKNAEWNWTSEHQMCFEEIKERLKYSPTLSYFDTKLETSLIVDASPVGLGALLAQKDKTQGTMKTIAYASRILSETESRYSQIEREALAIVWGIKHFHLYIYASQFTVFTDHKPLVPLFNNPRSSLSLRLERWRLELLPYTFQVQYMSGDTNPADFLSRHPRVMTTAETTTEFMTEPHVNLLTNYAVPKSLTLDQIKEGTKSDPTLCMVIESLRTGKWNRESETFVNKDDYKSLEKVKQELSVTESQDILLRGSLIVIPQKLRSKVIELAHAGHQGTSRTKALLREKVWFPNLDKDVENRIKNCMSCAATVLTQTNTPVHMSPLPTAPWREVSIDFYGPLPAGKHILVVIDDYSRFPEVEIIDSTSTEEVLPVLNRIFSSFGIPEVVRTDNDGVFVSERFRHFAETLGFHHRRITPYWPRANGEVERFMRTLAKTLQISQMEHGHWDKMLHTFLRNYRATPHPSTSKSPYELLFSRKPKTTLPENPSIEQANNDIAKKDKTEKEKMRQYATKHSQRRRRMQVLNKGDRVLVKQERRNKLTTAYDPTPYVVTEVKGTRVTASNSKHTITRHESFFKVLSQQAT